MKNRAIRDWESHVRGGGTWGNFVSTVGFNQPLPRPHYSDARYASGKTHTLFGKGDPRSGDASLSYEYSDRLWQWDYAKMERAGEAATKSGAPRNSPHWWQEALSHFHDRPVTLHHVIGGVNVSNGYEYYVFGFRFADD